MADTSELWRKYSGRDTWDSIREWRAEYGGVDLDNEEIDSWRDRSPPKTPDLCRLS